MPKNHHDKKRNPYYLINNQPTHSNSNDSDNLIDSNISEDNQAKISNTSMSNIRQSGNSDVDVHIDVHIDNSAVAYAILSSLYATNQMNIQEFNTAVRKLKELIRKEDYTYHVTYPAKSGYKKYISGND